MSWAPWIAVAIAFVALIASQFSQWVKTSNDIAVNGRRLAILEEWRKDKSIDRSELESAKETARTEYTALAERMRVEKHDIDGRISSNERITNELTKTLNDVRMDIARIPEQLKRQEEVQNLHHEALKHSMNNLKMMMQAISPRSILPPTIVE